MSKIFKEILKVDDCKIIKTIRLGKTNPDKSVQRSRPLLIKMRHVDEKYDVLNNAKKLKSAENPEIKSLWITKDLTRQEREIQKKNYLEKKVNRAAPSNSNASSIESTSTTSEINQ